MKQLVLGSLFNSKYNGRVLFICLAFFSLSLNAQIAVTRVITDPYCIGTTTGSVKLTASGGLAPYSFQMISPSVGAVNTINSSPYEYTFSGLGAANYQFKVTDANGNIITSNVVLSNPTAVSYNIAETFKKTLVCDSIDVSPWLYTNGTIRPNYKLEFWVNSNTATGSPTISFSNLTNVGSYFRIPMANFGANTVVRLTDSCGNVSNDRTFVSANIVHRAVPSSSLCNASNLRVNFNGLTVPATFSLYAGSSVSGSAIQTITQNTIVQEVAVSNTMQYGGEFVAIPNGTYTIVGTDACGKTYTKTVNFTGITKNIPSAAASLQCANTSVDSTATFRIGSSTWSTPYTVTIVSGPSSYNHSNTAGILNTNLSYPVTLTSRNISYIELSNMPMGTYRIAVLDSCGWTDTVTYVVDASLIAKISVTAQTIPGCLDANSLRVTVNHSCFRAEHSIVVKNSAGTVVGSSGLTSNTTVFTINNLPAGTYYASFNGISTGSSVTTSSGNNVLVYSVLQHINVPTSMKIPLVLDPYYQPSVTGSIVAPCPNSTVGSLTVSVYGVPPNSYELLNAFPDNTVLAGPQTSDTFSGISTASQYRVRVTDACGNANVSGNISFAGANNILNVTTSSNCIAANGTVTLTADSINLTKYSWTGPNGFTSLLRSPSITNFSSLKAGKYYVTSTTVGNCTDIDSIVIYAKPNAGLDKSVGCYATGSTTMTGTGTGTWSLLSTSPIGLTANIVTPSSATTVINTFSAAGTYSFIFNNNGCSDTVIISVGNTCTCPIANNNIITIGSTQCAPFAGIIIDGTTATPSINTSYQWQVNINGAGWNNASGSSTNEDYATGTLTSGIYQFRRIFIYAEALVCRDTTSAITFTINATPNAGMNQYTCPGNTLTITGTSPSTGTWSALSTNGSGATLGTTSAGVATVTVDSTATGIYSFVYTVLYCTDTMNVIIGLATNPSPAVNSGVNPICRNGNVQLCPTVWGWSNYQWYKNGVAVLAPKGTGSCITLDSTEVGSYTLTASNGAGCWSAASAAIVVTYNNTITCTVTGGGSGGVESKTIGDVIAQRLYGNARASKTAVDGLSNNVKFVKSGVVVNGTNNLKLSDLVPATVNNTDAAYVSTPTDLVNFTNAVEVLAIDYTKDNSIKAVAFGTKTLGDVYTHTKPICDRLKGATLLETKTVTVKGYKLIAYKVQQCTGEVEYAINLSAGTDANRTSISLQSNWFTDSYVQDENLYNFQLWAVSEAMVTDMASKIITTLQANGTVNAVIATDLPKAYVTAGNRKANMLTLNITNNTTATTAIVELKERATETAMETTRQVQVAINANGTSIVNVDVKDSYEATINLLINNNKTDMLYLNDGTWALDYNKANTNIQQFNVTNATSVTNATNEYRLLRNVNIAATSKDYVTAYKTIVTKCNALALSNYNSLKFNAAATGASSVTITLISSDITNWNEQYSYTLSLDGRTEDYAIGLNNFKSSKHAIGVNQNSITGVSFAFNTSRGVPTAMNVSLNNARFSTASVTAAENTISLGVYPNPTNNGKFTASYTSNSNQSLVLKVVDIATGRVVKTQFINAVKGVNQTKVELSKTNASGNFIVTLEGDDMKYTPVKVMMGK